MLKTSMLRAFVAVARAGNLVDGASAIGRTPSAVSMTLKSIEDHLGRPLFEGGRKNRLTPLGVFTLDMAERELQHFARTVGAVEDFAGARRGEVRIAAVPSYASAALPGIALGFQKLHPHVRLDIRDMDSASILRALDREHVDLGIVSDARHQPEYERNRLGADPFGLVVRSDAAYSAEPALNWNSLPNAPLIANPLCERIDAPALQDALANASLRVHNTMTLLAMVRAGLGVTILPKMVIGAATHGLAFVPIEGPLVRRELHLLTRVRDTPSPATAAFKTFLTEAAIQD